jgi:protein TonB
VPRTTSNSQSPAGTTGRAEAASEFRPPQLVSRVEPVYPDRSRKRGEGGVVELRVLVSEKGRVVRVVVEEGLPGSDLEARAIDAALRSIYRPATEGGRPVSAWVTERIVFGP